MPSNYKDIAVDEIEFDPEMSLEEAYEAAKGASGFTGAMTYGKQKSQYIDLF